MFEFLWRKRTSPYWWKGDAALEALADKALALVLEARKEAHIEGDTLIMPKTPGNPFSGRNKYQRRLWDLVKGKL